ncbi:hypothetical protein PRZ48_009943 [Zasmidium cellare]|uniref:DUF6536 domain-containing protein n=1 Tax=Zasmidium cellare TaxID=395010 RepID=A0ABR0ED57_ZASCE|nr:hypothetical protein PRZ48_009943 [Zasmidium cellare]
MLLGASNYTMQALVAPTRAETDRAHAEGGWLDIGVASIRNLFKIKRHRTILWAVLGLSSMPIHLLYNSAVFETIGANPYIATVASPAWINGGDLSTVVQITIPSSLEQHIPFHESDMRERAMSIRNMFQANLHNTSRVQNLSTQECISTYSPSFVSRNNHVVAITNEVVHTSRTSYFDIQDDDTDEKVWMCADIPGRTYTYTCDPRQINPTNWTIYDRKIDYCLSEVLPQHCKVQFSAYILVVVIFMNAVKSIAMFVAVRGHKDVTLVTIGDAIASYMEAPGEFAQAGCLLGRKDVKRLKKEGQATRARHLYSEPKAYAPVYHARWSKAASQARWLSCLFLIVTALTATGILMFQAGSAFGLGWGTLDLNALLPLKLSGGQGIMYGVLLANTPQLLASFLYVVSNSLLTTLLLGKEWSDFARQRKALRVTTRRGAQRSTYWLQLPYRYSIPLLVILATLHWVISQSLFLARIAYYFDGVPFGQDADVSSVGYSLGPILTAMVIILVSTAALVALGFRKLDPTMPIAGSCSLAIAAACHRPKDDVDAARKPVQWGEVVGEGGNGEVGHCCFTSQPVTSPIPGRLYA